MPRRKAETLQAVVEASVAAMTWLQPSDQATVKLVLTYAKAIDQGDDKTLFLGPHLLAALKALGGTPAERKALGVEEAAHGKLAGLRALRSG